MKPGKTFNLSKTAKRMIALMGGTDENRNQFKRMMIQAELAASIQPKREKRPAGPGGYQKNLTGTASTRD
jgi:hypothetical protein